MEELSGLGAVAIALLSGAGGSVLLEVFWRPWRARKKAAALLLSEILLNTELLLMQAHARFKNPKSIPADFHMSELGWSTAASSVVELPPKALKSALLLYMRYRDLNSNSQQYFVELQQVETSPVGSEARRKAEHRCAVIIDVFNTGIDSAIEHAKALTLTLFKLSRIKPEREMDSKALQAKVDDLLAGREERLRPPGEGGNPD
jgi:hypothetical protein